MAAAPPSKRDELASLHSITSSARREQRRRDGQTEGLRGLEIDDKLEFHRLLDRQGGRIFAFQIRAV